MLRPWPCRWFELITTRDDLAALLEALARAGAVELQTHEQRAAPLVIAGTQHTLERFRELARIYHSHWPPPRAAGTARMADPAATLAARLAQVEAWCRLADPLIAEAERQSLALMTLADLGRLLAAAPARLPHPDLLAGARRFVVDARVYALSARSAASELPAGVLQQLIPAADGGEDFAVVVGRMQDLAEADARFAALRARRVVWPHDLHGDLPQAARQVAERRSTLERSQVRLAQQLQDLAQRHELPDALADIAVIEWLVRHGSQLSASDRLVWVSGWTTAADDHAFCAPLDRLGLRCVLQFPAPPAGSEPPSLLANPPWVRAFEGFARLLGQPGSDEADPSPLVALIAPLLFGFMFGDIGQGAVLCIAGWLLRKRAPTLVMLVPGGLMAMLFGALFGSVFAREDLIPALWLHPLHEPVTLLLAAVGMGAAILLGGLLLNATQAHWRRAAPQWWLRDAGLVLAYVSLLAGLAWPPRRADLLNLALAGTAWFVLGSMLVAPANRLAALGAGLAQFVEQALQLLVNTVSFARVGAFALAHAGLSAAVTGVAEALGGAGYWIVLLLGNLLILALEGLVVGIQTTRLLLFEFFVRFLKGTGRVFRPLPPPLAQTLPTTGTHNA
jgi:V/A-type H+-transporting ATPase subunit I